MKKKNIIPLFAYFTKISLLLFFVVYLICMLVSLMSFRYTATDISASATTIFPSDGELVQYLLMFVVVVLGSTLSFRKGKDLSAFSLLHRLLCAIAVFALLFVALQLLSAQIDSVMIGFDPVANVRYGAVFSIFTQSVYVFPFVFGFLAGQVIKPEIGMDRKIMMLHK